MTAIAEPAVSARHLRAEAPRKAQLSDRAKAERRLGWYLAGPAFAVMVLVTGYPIVSAVYLSFFRDRLTDPDAKAFIGLKNYGVVLTDRTWWHAVFFSVVVLLITVSIEFVLGMALALVMDKVIIPRRTLRTIVLIPYSIVTVVSAFGWQYAFSTSNGWIDGFLHHLTFGAFASDYDWFGGSVSSTIAICVSEIWKTTPFMSLLLLAGLAQVPGELLEAAQVDGATWWQRMRKVILPAMKASIMVALLFRALDAFRIFDNIFIMTKGSQGTSSVSIVAYNQTISRTEVGLGSAISVLIFAIVIVLCFIFIKLFRTDLSRVRGE
jgi:multiple sugar transport system permease protein